MAKRGRPRGPCNPRELAQRRGAAWKHGERAATPLRRAIHPCREDLCPMSYPCALREKVAAAGGALEACLLELAISDDLREGYRRALAEGDLTGLRVLVADTLASMAGVHQREMLSIILEGGFATKAPVFSKDGEEIGSRLIQNPRAIPFLELSKLLGLSADQQAVTPKSRGETERDISAAKHLDWMRNFAAALPPAPVPLPSAAEGDAP